MVDTNGRLEVRCNGEGVLLVEAETDSTLQDTGLLTQSLDLSQLIPTLDYSGDISSLPLLLFQVTFPLWISALLSVENLTETAIVAALTVTAFLVLQDNICKIEYLFGQISGYFSVNCHE